MRNGPGTSAAVAAVLITMIASFAAYELSGAIAAPWLHEAVARVSGATYFASVAFGAFAVYTVASLGGAPVGRATFAAALAPSVWMTKESARLYTSHPLPECLYYFLNPLNVWLVLLIVLEIGVATFVVRAVRKRRGEDLAVWSAGPTATIVVSLGAFVGLYAWGRGENLYVVFLAGYRALFGSGV